MCNLLVAHYRIALRIEAQPFGCFYQIASGSSANASAAFCANSTAVRAH
jgi:hypothetical protein